MESPFDVDVIAHVFLPRKLPASADDAELLRLENYLLDRFAAFLRDQSPETLFGAVPDRDRHEEPSAQSDVNEFQSIQALFSSWRSVQCSGIGSPAVDAFTKALSQLAVGDSFAYYVRKQNATMLITRPEADRCRFSSFIASQANESIMKADGDLVAQFPGVCIDIPFSTRLHSETFAGAVLHFQNMTKPYSGSLKKTRKAGMEFNEERDVVHPMLVTEYLTCALTDKNSSPVSQTSFQRVQKKIRDQIAYGGGQNPFRRSGLWLSVKVVLQLELVNRFGFERGRLLYKLLMLSFMETCCHNACLRSNAKVSSDLIMEMLAKVSRRLAKVSKCISIMEEDRISSYFGIVQGQVHETVKLVRGKVDESWTELMRKANTIVEPIALDDVAIQKATEHVLKKSSPFLIEEKSETRHESRTSLASNDRDQFPDLRTGRSSYVTYYDHSDSDSDYEQRYYRRHDYDYNHYDSDDEDYRNDYDYNYDSDSYMRSYSRHRSGGLRWTSTSSSYQNHTRSLSLPTPTPASSTRFRLASSDTKADIFPRQLLLSAKGHDESDRGLILYDFERYIGALLPDFCSESNCQQLLELLETYIDAATTFYAEDPVGGSRMVLTCLKIVQLLDIAAVVREPLLADHDSGVKESILQDVLVPFKRDCLALSELETYFRERNTRAKYTSLIEERDVSRNTFTVRAAGACPEMTALRDKILEETRVAIETKKQKLEEVRARCAQLREEEETLECEYRTETDEWGFEHRRHESSCTKCRLRLEIKACTVSKYEKPLPERVDWQNAVVYELMIPLQVAVLRDALFVFSKKICAGNMMTNAKVAGRWTKDTPVSSHTCVNSATRPQKYVELVSTTKAMLKSHYGRTEGDGQCSSTSAHVDQPDEVFILNNGFQCSFGSVGGILCFNKTASEVNVKKHCTLSVEKGSAYVGLQWTLISTSHSQNEVLAKQNECPDSLSLAEYKEFGSLRAGHRLQYRNILRAIATHSLSFREESVLSLICQAVWEAGPSSGNANADTESSQIYREAHKDLSVGIGADDDDTSFSYEFLVVLERFLEKNAKNWNDQHVLLVVTVLANRIRCMIPWPGSTGQKAVELTLACRQVALDWCAEIETILAKMTDSKQGNPFTHTHTDGQTSLRLKLVQIASAGALTYAADNEGALSSIAADDKSLAGWLFLIAKIEDNILLTTSSNSGLGVFTKNLLRSVRCVGVDLESYFHQRLETSKEALHLFTTDVLANSSRPEPVVGWRRCDSPADQCYILKRADKEVTDCDDDEEESDQLELSMDIILGKFLVNGQPVGRLPYEITSDSTFSRLFGGLVFEVHSVNRSLGVYATKHRYHGCMYRFQRHPHTRELIVTETDLDGVEAKLVPHEKFEGDIPASFVQEFSHWLQPSTNTVQFRPKVFLADDFRTHVKYLLRLDSKTLVETRSQRALVDINSDLYKKLCKVVSRLEDTKYVHMFHEPSTTTAKVCIELPRHGLHFYGTEDGSILSREYRGYKVSPTQGYGTLIGLEKGLLLVCENANPTLLLPHGTPSRKHGHISTKSGHKTKVTSATTTIEINTLRHPSFFVFELDATLQRIKAPPVLSAWLYLVHLHALTGRVLPDPFTGLTGTESALRILQQAFCWSGELLNGECITTLEAIDALSPTRSYYPTHLQEMEKVEFPTALGISSSAAHEGFAFIVQKLYADSKRLAFLQPNDASLALNAKNRKVNLARRAYWRSYTACSPQARIDPEFDPTFSTEPVCVPVSSLDLSGSRGAAYTTSYTSPNLQAVRLLAHVGGESWLLPSKLVPSLLTSSICNASDVVGPAAPVEEGVGVVEGVDPALRFKTSGFSTWSELDVTRNWLLLYNYARGVLAQGHQVPWTFMLTSIAYAQPEQLEHLKLLHAIAVRWDQFKDLDPPPAQKQPDYDFDYVYGYGYGRGQSQSYSNTSQHYFNESQLEPSITSCARQYSRPERQYGETQRSFHWRNKAARQAHEAMVRQQVQTVLSHLRSNYGQLKKNVTECKLEVFGEFSHLYSLSSENRAVRAKLWQWYRNRKLKKFIGKVEARLHLVNRSNRLALTDLETFCSLADPVDERGLKTFAKEQRFDVNTFWVDQIQGSMKQSSSGDVVQHDFNLVKEISLMPAEHDDGETNIGQGQEVFPLGDSTDGGAGDADEIFKEYMGDLRTSFRVYIEGRSKSNEDAGALDIEKAHHAKAKITELARLLWSSLTSTMHLNDTSQEVNALRQAGLLHRVTPTTVFPLLLRRAQTTFSLPEEILREIEEVAVVRTQEQQVRRCIRLATAGSSMELGLRRELETVGYAKWSPSTRPEWLLLQLEMDIMIRGVQVDVAEELLSGGSHRLLQLNMGEGKTSVIIPMLVARLADGGQLCRVTVLRSLYNTNRKMLAFTVGGLLNQRMYAFPCRRDMKLDTQNVATIQTMYEECAAKRGVVMTVPEFRLSFQLKGYDKCNTGELETARALCHTNSWLRNNSRDILDECDEILNVKYQLIYTIGEQQHVGGGQERWVVCQKVLKLLPKHLQTFLGTQGPQGEAPSAVVQYAKEGDAAQRVFPRCRIMNADCYTELCARIALDILNGRSDVSLPEIPAPVADNRATLLRFLTQPILDDAEHKAALRVFPSDVAGLGSGAGASSAGHADTLLILRGLLAYGVLLHCLTRRWRVNYGVNPTGSKKMAVPFRAKDVASDRTEFGHTDVAIALTQLSYYYSGLSNSQVLDCFKLLARFDNKDTRYAHWVQGIPNLDPSISTLAGINLEDYNQTNCITIPALRRNMRVIDFWLSHAVFPKESKQFPYKMTTTPWDLVSSFHPVGFSGTANDAKLLLPLLVQQRNIPALEGTNGEVLHDLVRPENDAYFVIPLGATGSQILGELVRNEIPLLLDVGALMIDLSNEALARTWLELLPPHMSQRYKAVLYLNDSDEMMVLDHEGRTTSFTFSPYRTNLEACLIYLDDHHTRGTDLKIPRGTKGAVTLGKGVTKDKLVQGAMRMRMLGNGHSVAFYASQEVDAEIRTFAFGTSVTATLGAKEVVLWALGNSCTVTRDGFQYWANAAANYYTKQVGELVYESSTKQASDLTFLGRVCREDEVQSLADIYGTPRQEKEFHEIAKRKMLVHTRYLEICLRRHASSTPSAILQAFVDGARQVVERCEKYTGAMRRFTSMLDEEQERELEHEQEEERQKERPGSAQPVKPHLDPRLIAFVQSPTTTSLMMNRTLASSWYVPLPQALRNTKIWTLMTRATPRCMAPSPEGEWATNMFATRDFCRVVEHAVAAGVGVADYLRPVNWILSVMNCSGSDSDNVAQLLLLSPFEVNEVIGQLRTGRRQVPRSVAVHLHMYAARLHPDHCTFWQTPTLVVPGPMKFLSSTNHVALLNANLLVFSGSLFFSNAEEQEFYCNILGLVPSPRTAAEENAVDEGYIKNGWMLPQFRVRAASEFGLSAALVCKFIDNPAPFVQMIIECRHETLPETSHVSKILLESKKTNFLLN